MTSPTAQATRTKAIRPKAQATYAQEISAALNAKLSKSHAAPKRLVAKVGLRQQDHLLYIALEAVKQPGVERISAEHIPDPRQLLPQLRQFLSEAQTELDLGWVQLAKVSGRLPKQIKPLWQEDLLLRLESPIANTLMTPQPVLNSAAATEAAAASEGDVSINIGGNMSGQLIVGDNNQAFSYTYNVETGGVVNVATPPTIRPRPIPIALKPRPFKHLLDRKTVLPLLKKTLLERLPVEVFAEAGFGKTSLMRHLAHDQSVTDAFSDGVVYLAVHRQMAEDLLQSLYDAFYEAMPAFKPSQGQLRQALKDKQALVILNGLKLAKDGVAELLSILPKCTFVLVSEAQVYWQDGAAIALLGLPLLESITLIQKDLGRPLTEPEQGAAQFLHTEFSGNPLQLRRIAAQARTTAQSLVDIVQSMRAEPDEISGRSLFAKMTERLSTKHKSVLALMGAMGGIALTAAQAEAIAAVPNTANVLSELADLHLIEPAVESAVGSVSNGYQLSADLTEATVQTFDPQPWLTEATNYFCESAATQAAHSDALAHLLDWTQSTGNWQQSIELCKSLDQSLSLSGQWAQWQQVMTQSLYAAEQMGNGAAEAWSLHQLGTQALTTGSEQAEGLLSRALWLRQQLGDKAGAAVTRHNLGLILPPLLEEFDADLGSSAQVTEAVVSSGRSAGWSSLAIGGAVALGAIVSGVVGFAMVSALRSEESATIAPVQVEDDSSLGEGPQTKEPAAKFGFDRETLTFSETAVGQQSQQSLNILNSGLVPLMITAVDIGGRQGTDYSVQSEGCSAAVLAPGKQCEITLLFVPKKVGNRTANLILQSNAAEATTLPIRGIALKKSASKPTPPPTTPPSTTPTPTTTPTTPTPTTSTPPPSAEPPQARDDTGSVSSKDSTYIDVLRNDSDPAAGNLTIVSVSPGEFGQTEISDGGIIYYHSGQNTNSDRSTIQNEAEETATANIFSDRFAYTIQNEAGETATANVFVAITATKPTPNRAPIPINHSFEIREGESITVDLLKGASDPDQDDLTLYDIADQSDGGQLIDNGDGTATYVPWENKTGEQLRIARNRFQYRITDGRGGFGTAVVEIIVRPVSRPTDRLPIERIPSYQSREVELPNTRIVLPADSEIQ